MEVGDSDRKGLFLINYSITDKESAALIVRLISKFESEAFIVFDDNRLSLTIVL